MLSYLSLHKYNTDHQLSYYCTISRNTAIHASTHYNIYIHVHTYIILLTTLPYILCTAAANLTPHPADATLILSPCAPIVRTCPHDYSPQVSDMYWALYYWDSNNIWLSKSKLVWWNMWLCHLLHVVTLWPQVMFTCWADVICSCSWENNSSTESHRVEQKTPAKVWGNQRQWNILSPWISAYHILAYDGLNRLLRFEPQLFV